VNFSLAGIAETNESFFPAAASFLTVLCGEQANEKIMNK
jgi:hypothetical protein